MEDPCLIVLDVSRADGDEFARDFRAKLRDALRKHADFHPTSQSPRGGGPA